MSACPLKSISVHVLLLVAAGKNEDAVRAHTTPAAETMMNVIKPKEWLPILNSLGFGIDCLEDLLMVTSRSQGERAEGFSALTG